MNPPLPQVGAFIQPDSRTRFTVWAPLHERLSVHFPGRARSLEMTPGTDGYHNLVTDAPAGTLYQFEFTDGRRRPDPASLAQPEGVHGPSMVVDRAPPAPTVPFNNPPLASHVLYELHVGTFTPDGTFDAVIPRLADLKQLGVTAIELMPIGQFPGERNWGYDGVTLFAVQHSYGGLEGLRRLVDACHSRGIAVILDVVYNHLGPEGNYLGEFGPYFTDKYKTPWGSALNFDGPASDHVREFFIQNSLFWTRDCAVDGLRLDAVHAIVDHTASTFVEELAARNHTECNAKGRHTIIIAESNDNDPKLVRPASLGGYGLDGCWNDDYHHAIRAAITGDRRGYYSPFGDPTLIATALNNRYVFTGQHSSGYQRRHGAPALDIDHAHLVVFTQNHDQVGNRPMGDRLDHSAGRDGARLAAALVFLSPYTPMLWMGEEYAETAPFQYFVSHTDPGLVEAVRKGRAREFEGFEFEGNATVPDPQSEQTFRRSTLNWALRSDPHHAPMLAYYTELLRLRRALNIPAGAGEPTAQTHGSIVTLTYHGPQPITILANTASTDATASLPPSQSGLQLLLDSADKRWGGPRSTSLSIPGSISSITLNAKTALVLRAAKELA